MRARPRELEYRLNLPGFYMLFLLLRRHRHHIREVAHAGVLGQEHSSINPTMPTRAVHTIRSGTSSVLGQRAVAGSSPGLMNRKLCCTVWIQHRSKLQRTRDRPCIGGTRTF